MPHLSPPHILHVLLIIGNLSVSISSTLWRLFVLRITALILLLSLLPLSCAALPAFPGAEGFGSHTPGGRGGKVLAVTNLDDSGPGSLRAACEAEGARFVVFHVGGTIRLKSPIKIKHPFITIAGQTAPGDGILIRDAGVQIAAHDVVIRFIRVRVGEERNGASNEQDCINIGGEECAPAYNVVIDHCSFSWSVDENADSYRWASDFTFSWCIFSEALRKSIHKKGDHSMGMLLGPGSTRSSIHHCLFAHNNSRNPRVKSGRRDVVNNVVYNWGAFIAPFSGCPEVNFVANYFKAGPNSSNTTPLIADYGEGGIGAVYLRDNVFADGTPAGWERVQAGENAIRAERRFHAMPVTTHSADDAYWLVLDGVGCKVPASDLVDQRVLNDVRNGTGRIIDHPEDVGGYPDIRGGQAAVDSDRDGIGDEWESAHGLKPNDASDGPADVDGDGYTNLEDYLNSLVVNN